MSAAVLPRNMRVAPPREAIPIILDSTQSPVVALDTEFDPSMPTCRTDLRGLSLAGGLPSTGMVGTFFAFGEFGDYSWDYVADQVLRPILQDPGRTLVMHPPKVDSQLLRARGLRNWRCSVECTFSMIHLYEEEMPKGLKDLGEALLGIQGLLSHAQTVKLMKGIRKAGEKKAKAIIKQCWEVYRDERKRSKVEEVDLDPAWPSWKRIAMALPPKMKKADVVDTLSPRINAVVRKDHERKAAEEYASYGAIDALLTLGVRYFLIDGIPGVIDGLPDSQVNHLALETTVCHPIVTEMEERGVKIDVGLMRDIHDACQQAIVELEDDLRRLWAPALDREDDPEWKPGSFDQIGEILWNRWGHRPPPWAQKNGEIKPSFRIAKTGLCSTKDEVLTYLVEKKKSKHAEAIQRLLDWRGFTKIFTTYVVPMLQMALADPLNRIHASFWPVGTRTGRFSASDPNLENIPRPTSMPLLRIPAGADPSSPPRGVAVEGKGDKVRWRVRSLRDVFIAETGYRFVSADLAQIENRLIAHESQDPVLLKLFRKWDCADCGETGETDQPLHACPNCGAPDGKRDKSVPEQPPVKGFCLGMDIHAMTAHSIGLVERMGFAEGRQLAKAINHAFNYGMGAGTLSRNAGITYKAAEQHLKNLDRTYAKVRSYLHPRVRDAIRNHGRVVMFDGHERRFYAARLLMDTNNMEHWREEGIYREAVNVLAQGGTGVVMKRAMVAIWARLRERGRTDKRFLDVHLVNQVHDELLYECPAEIADEVYAIVIWEMEHAAPELSVPVLADGATGKTWGEAH